MNKFTPGPWHVSVIGSHEAEIRGGVRDNSVRVYVDHRQWMTDPKRDANLIAAAPEMFSALVQVREFLTGKKSLHRFDEMVELVERTICKAEGPSNVRNS